MSAYDYDRVRAPRRANAMVGWTWVKRYQAMLDEYTREIAHEASQQLMNEAVTVGKIGTNFVEGMDGNGQAVQVMVNPAGWGVVKVHVRRGSKSKEWKMELAGTDPKMIAGQAILQVRAIL